MSIQYPVKKTVSSALVYALMSLVAAFSLATASFAQGAGPFALHDGDRVVMYGDSITEQRLYTVQTETFVTTRYPRLAIDWIDSGWGGDRVGGGIGGPIDVRLTRDVIAYKPTVVTIMLGMNDGSYRAYDDGIFNTYTTGYQHIVDRLTKELPGVRMTLIGPSAYDDVTQTPSFPGGYNAVLAKFSDYVKSLAQKSNQNFADFNAPMVATLGQAKANDPRVAASIIPGRVHPSAAGHLIMTEALLKSWNVSPIISAVTIDTAGKSVKRQENATITDLKIGDSITWKELDGSLPFPIDTTDPATALVVKSSDIVDALDQQTLIVTGLSPATYSLAIDDKVIGTFTSDQLNAGVNLATLATPMADQARHVRTLIIAHDATHTNRWRVADMQLGNDPNPALKQPLADVDRVLDTEERDTVGAVRKLAQPVAHSFTLAPVAASPIAK